MDQTSTGKDCGRGLAFGCILFLAWAKQTMELIIPETARFDSLAVCCQAMSHDVLHGLQQVIARQGYCTLVLPGGKTPAALFARLRVSADHAPIDWGKVFFFFGDERCVPLYHADSNYGMAQEHLLAHLPISKRQVFPMPVAISPPKAAARRYQETISEFFGGMAGRRLAAADYPAFDLIILGMGEDGHTASLFPGHPALASTDWVVEVESRQVTPPVPRLTLTLPVIKQADTVLFLISGASKMRLADTILSRPPESRYPASLVRSRRRLVWYMAP